MAILGYCFDENGHYTEMITLQERPIYVKRTVNQPVPELKVTEEKLCELHQSIENGTHEPVEGEEIPPKELCPNCVMYKEEIVYVDKPVVIEEYAGSEPIVPENCTLEPCPDLIFEPVFKDGKWVKMKPDLPPVEPTKPPEKAEVEKLQEQVTAMKKVLDEILLGGVM